MQKKECQKDLLRECPFCGGEVKVKSCSSNFFTSVFEIVCRECGCRQVPSIHKEAVVEAWNTRKPMDDIVERLRELQKMNFEAYEVATHIPDKIGYIQTSNAYANAIDIVRNAGKEGGEP